MLSSSWASFIYLGAMFEHVGAKMANKMHTIATKSAKMNQDGPTWAAKANDRWYRKALPGPVCGRNEPPRALEFAKRKDQRGRQDLAKNLQGFDEVVLHAGSPFGDSGFIQCAARAKPPPCQNWKPQLEIGTIKLPFGFEET